MNCEKCGLKEKIVVWDYNGKVYRYCQECLNAEKIGPESTGSCVNIFDGEGNINWDASSGTAEKYAKKNRKKIRDRNLL